MSRYDQPVALKGLRLLIYCMWVKKGCQTYLSSIGATIVKYMVCKYVRFLRVGRVGIFLLSDIRWMSGGLLSGCHPSGIH